MNKIKIDFRPTVKRIRLKYLTLFLVLLPAALLCVPSAVFATHNVTIYVANMNNATAYKARLNCTDGSKLTASPKTLTVYDNPGRAHVCWSPTNNIQPPIGTKCTVSLNINNNWTTVYSAGSPLHIDPTVTPLTYWNGEVAVTGPQGTLIHHSVRLWGYQYGHCVINDYSYEFTVVVIDSVGKQQIP